MIKGGLTFKMSEAVYGSMIELQCLNYLFQTNSFQLVILNGLTEDHFSTYKEHFKFIRDFYNKYQQLPSKETFQGKFADNFEWLTVTDPEEYLIEKLNESKLYRDLIKDYKHFAKLITSEKTDEALADALNTYTSAVNKANETYGNKAADVSFDAEKAYASALANSYGSSESDSD